MRFLLCLVGVVTAMGCQPAREPAATEVATAAAPPAVPETPPARAPVVIGGVDLSQPARALGTEPVWGVEIKPDELVFTGVDRAEIRAPHGGAVLEGATAVISSTDATGQTLVLRLDAGACSDGMSDRVYSLAAEVRLGAETLKGCAASQAMLDSQPKP